MKIKPVVDITLPLIGYDPKTKKMSSTFFNFNFSKDKTYEVDRESYGISMPTKYMGKIGFVIDESQFNSAFKEIK